MSVLGTSSSVPVRLLPLCALASFILSGFAAAAFARPVRLTEVEWRAKQGLQER